MRYTQHSKNIILFGNPLLLGMGVVSMFILLVFFVGISPAQAMTYSIPPIASQTSELVPAPEIVQVVDSTPTTMTVRWITGLRSIFRTQQIGVVLYEVKVFDKKTDDLVFSTLTAESIVVVEGLKKNKGYVVGVTAQRSGIRSEEKSIVARTSPPSPRAVVVRTEEQDIPRDVFTNKPIGRGESAGNRFIARLEWKKPAGKIRYYTVEVYDAFGNKLLQTVEVSKPEAMVAGLLAGQKYSYQVIAHFNDQYASPASELNYFTVKRK